MNTGKQIRFGAVLSYVQMALGIVIGILYTPVMIRKLGQSEYGLYVTAASIISMLSILSLGFGSGYLKFFAKYKAKDDEESICRLNGLFMLIFSIVGIVALAIGMFLSFNLQLVYDQGLTAEEYRIAKVLMILLTLNLALSFPMSVFGTIISANEKFVFQKIVEIGKTALVPLMTLPLLLCGMKSVAVVSVTVLIALLVDVANIIFVFGKLKQKFYFYNFEKGLFKSLFVYTSFILINTIVRQVNWNVDKVLLGRFQGTVMVAIYGVAATLHTYYETFSTSISSVFRTRVHMIVNTTELDSPEQKKALTDLFTRVGRVQFFILGLIASGLIFFGYDFIVGFWVGAGYEDSYWVCLLLILPTTIALIQTVGIDVQRALNRHKFRSIAYLIMSVGNVAMTIFLCQKYGAIGAAIGTAISVFLIDGVVLNIYYQKRCNLNILAFWGSILRASIGLIPPCIFGYLINRFLPTNNVVWLYLLKIFAYTVIYVASIWILSVSKEEKEKVLNFLRKRKKKPEQ